MRALLPAPGGLPHQPNLTPSALVGTFGTQASRKNYPITDAYFPEYTIASELKAYICRTLSGYGYVCTWEVLGVKN